MTQASEFRPRSSGSSLSAQFSDNIEILKLRAYLSDECTQI